MDHNNSADVSKLIIAALLRDVHTLHSSVFDLKSMRLTYHKVCKRIDLEGISFLTKTLPRLGKALDRALTCEDSIDATKLAFKSLPGSKLPMLMGELFELIFTRDGWVLPNPCIDSIKTLRSFFYLFYKYELPYSAKAEQRVIQQFAKTEDDIRSYHERFSFIADRIEGTCTSSAVAYAEETSTEKTKTPVKASSQIDGIDLIDPPYYRSIVRRARSLLSRLFEHFDPEAIVPRHGPGVVSTKERLWDKWRFTNVPSRITDVYPLDAYFYASLGHVCDSIREISLTNDQENAARVLLVPKDSRGPRLISCEPLENQYVQQGLGRAIMSYVEHHPLTKDSVYFTDQQPNQNGALFGSRDGVYATLDLKEASDRVSVGLVRLLFPSKVLPYLLACRSLATRLPDGRELSLNKYAPMGSALCFPIMALTIWSILAAGITDTATGPQGLYVYGDDVIVPTAQAANAIKHLEAFGLLVNRAKSCVSGFFRESCGVDAYKGEDITPLRFRNVWPSNPDPQSYNAWIDYSNHAYDRKYYTLYGVLTERLYSLFGPIPSDALRLAVPSLREVPDSWKPLRRRNNLALQRLEYYVPCTSSVPIRHKMNGWRMLHRFFCEANATSTARSLTARLDPTLHSSRAPTWSSEHCSDHPFSADQYTRRGELTIHRRWR